MYVRVIRVDLGFGTAEDLVTTIEAEVQPIYTNADGFIAYLLVPLDELTVLSVRAFEDRETLEAANGAAVAAMTELGEVYGLTLSEIGQGEAYGAVVGYKEPWWSSIKERRAAAEPEPLDPIPRE